MLQGEKNWVMTVYGRTMSGTTVQGLFGEHVHLPTNLTFSIRHGSRLADQASFHSFCLLISLSTTLIISKNSSLVNIPFSTSNLVRASSWIKWDMRSS